MLIKNHLLILFIFICFVFLNQKQVFSKSELHTKTYVFKTCIGESSICDDNFNEKIIISKNRNNQWKFYKKIKSSFRPKVDIFQ